MMAGVMVFGTSYVSFAEEEVAVEEAEEETEESSDAIEMNWADIEAAIASEESLAGDFYELEEIGLKVYIPESFAAEKLTEEDTEEDTEAKHLDLAYFSTDDYAIVVTATKLDTTLEDYAAALPEQGVEESKIGFATINGIPAVVYSWMEEEDSETGVVSMLTDTGYVIEFAFGPTDDNFAPVAAVIMGSIQAI